MKKRVFIITLILLIFVTAFKIIVLGFKSMYQYYLINNYIDSYSTYTLIILITILLLTYPKKTQNQKLVNISIMIIGMLILGLSLAIGSLSSFMVEPTRQFYFSSPNGRNRLLVEEIRTITSCEIIGYKVVNKFFKVGDIQTLVRFGEPDLPITEGRYKIEWNNDDTVNVHVYSDGQDKSFIVNFNK